jgi:hypothetical protein
MEQSIHLYKLLQSSGDRIPIKIPETLILGYGFTNPTLIKSSRCLEYQELAEDQVKNILNNLFLNNTIIYKSRSGSTILSALPQNFEREYVYQVYIKGNKYLTRWTSTSGYHQSKYPINLRIQSEYIKDTINKVFITAKRSRLALLELEFIISNNSVVYCLAITKYAFSELKSLTRFHSLDNTIVMNLKPDTKKTFQKVLPLKKTQTKTIIGDKFSDLMKSSGSVKYIRYNQWKSIVDRGEKLLSNEALYSKIIAGISTRVLIKSTNNVKEVRKLAGLVRTSLLNAKFSLGSGEDSDKEKDLNVSNYRISFLPPKIDNLNTEPTATNYAVLRIFERASKDLDFLTKRK